MKILGWGKWKLDTLSPEMTALVTLANKLDTSRSGGFQSRSLHADLLPLRTLLNSQLRIFLKIQCTLAKSKLSRLIVMNTIEQVEL